MKRLLSLSLVLLSSVCWGQQSKTNAAAKLREAAAKELVLRALSESRSLRLPENRAMIESAAAALLWSTDPARARALYKGLAARVNEVATREQSSRRPQYMFVAQNLRRQLLYPMSQNDPVTALEFLITTRPTNLNRQQLAEEAAMEMELAAQMAQQDPKAALSLIDHSLESGWTHSFSNVLWAVQDPAIKQDLLKLAWHRMKKYDFVAQPDSLGAALQAFEALCANDEALSQTRALPPDTTLKREMAQLLASAALDPRIPRHLLLNVPEESSALRRYAPAKASELHATIIKMQQEQGGQEVAYRQLHHTMNSGSIEEATRLIETLPAEGRDGWYQQLAWNASGRGNLAEAERVITEHISDAGERMRMLLEMRKQQAFRLAAEGKIDQALSLINALEIVPEEQAMMYIQLAQSGQMEKKGKLRLLDDARQLLPQRSADAEQFQQLIQLSQAYSAADPKAALEILQTLVNRLEDLVPAISSVEGFFGQRGFIDGELSMIAGSMAANLFEQVNHTLATAGNEEFDGTLEIAQSIELPELRCRAMLAVAQGAFSTSSVQYSRHGYVSVYRGAVMME